MMLHMLYTTTYIRSKSLRSFFLAGNKIIINYKSFIIQI